MLTMIIWCLGFVFVFVVFVFVMTMIIWCLGLPDRREHGRVESKSHNWVDLLSPPCLFVIIIITQKKHRHHSHYYHPCPQWWSLVLSCFESKLCFQGWSKSQVRFLQGLLAQSNPKLHLTVMLQVLTCILVLGSARSNLAFGFRSPPLATDGTRTGLIELAPDEPETWMRNDLVANLRCIYFNNQQKAIVDSFTHSLLVLVIHHRSNSKQFLAILK